MKKEIHFLLPGRPAKCTKEVHSYLLSLCNLPSCNSLKTCYNNKCQGERKRVVGTLSSKKNKSEKSEKTP